MVKLEDRKHLCAWMGQGNLMGEVDKKVLCGKQGKAVLQLPCGSARAACRHTLVFRCREQLRAWARAGSCALGSRRDRLPYPVPGKARSQVGLRPASLLRLPRPVRPLVYPGRAAPATGPVGDHPDSGPRRRRQRLERLAAPGQRLTRA